MDGSSRSLYATDPSGSPHGNSPALSPFRRGASGRFGALNPFDNSGLAPAGSPLGQHAAADTTPGFDTWMAAQRDAHGRQAHGHERRYFTEQLHQEALASDPTPFTRTVNPSPRRAQNPEPADASARSPAARRAHNNELWPIGERTNHPRLSQPEHLTNHQQVVPMPNSHPVPHFAGQPPPLSHETAAPINPTPQLGAREFRHMSSEMTRGFQTSAGVLGWNLPGSCSSARESLTDASYVPPTPGAGINLLQPQPGGKEVHDPSPDGHRRGRSDLHYKISPRHERAERFARERKMADESDANAFRRSTTTATVPEIDVARQRKIEPPSVVAPKASSDIHANLGDREFRWHQKRAARNAGMADQMA